jgi:hypothetical protein
LDASEGAGQVGLFVERDDGYGQLRRHDGYPILRGAGAVTRMLCMPSWPDGRVEDLV